MSTTVRRNVPAATAALSALSLGLVFAVALGVVPRSALPRAPHAVVAAIPHVNAALSAVAIATIVAGWRFARRGQIRRHRAAMLAAFALFAGFLVLYLYRVALEGPTPFPGDPAVYRFVYLPTLVVHVSLAVVCVPLLYYVLLLAATRPVAEIPLSRHPRVGRVAASLWLVSFALGLVVYGLLYG